MTSNARGLRDGRMRSECDDISCDRRDFLLEIHFLVLYGARIRLRRLPKATSSSDPLDNL